MIGGLQQRAEEEVVIHHGVAAKAAPAQTAGIESSSQTNTHLDASVLLSSPHSLTYPSFMFSKARGPWNRMFLLILFWQLTPLKIAQLCFVYSPRW